MRRHAAWVAFLAVAVLGAVRLPSAAAATVQAEAAMFGVSNAGAPTITIEFDAPLPPSLSSWALSPATYEIAFFRGAPQADLAPALQQVAVRIKPPIEMLDSRTLRLTLEGDVFDEAHMRVKGEQVGADSLKESELTVRATHPYELAQSTFDWAAQYNGSALAAQFAYDHDDGSFVYSPGTVLTRKYYTAAGNLAVNVPDDVADTPGASRDASRGVADYLTASYRVQHYDGKSLSSYGLVARTTGTGRGLEVVANWQPFAAFASDGRVFVGAEGEAGYRNGDAEWESLTLHAPDRGNVVARLAFVGEWAPRLGSVNLDLGGGLRFYVRERVWVDYADNVSDRNPGVRVRDFTDSELFLNVSEKARVFLRCQRGSLPPDLSKNVNSIYAGIGNAF